MSGVGGGGRGGLYIEAKDQRSKYGLAPCAEAGRGRRIADAYGVGTGAPLFVIRHLRLDMSRAL